MTDSWIGHYQYRCYYRIWLISVCTYNRKQKGNMCLIHVNDLGLYVHNNTHKYLGVAVSDHDPAQTLMATARPTLSIGLD